MAARLLVLMRHAHAVATGEDHERALSERGRLESQAAGVYLATTGLHRVLCSTARRAVDTWREARETLESWPPVEIDPRLYLASPSAILDRIGEVPESASRLLVIGHNPGMHELAWDLARGSSVQRALASGMRPGTLACFDVRAEDWHDLTPGSVRGRCLWRPPPLPSTSRML